MGQQRGRWPLPVACAVTGLALWWDWSELVGAGPPAASGGRKMKRPDGADADGLVTCLECGRRFCSLGRT